MGGEIETWSHVLQSLHVTLAPHNLLYDDGDTFKDDAHNISLEPSALHARAKDLPVLSRSGTELVWGHHHWPHIAQTTHRVLVSFNNINIFLDPQLCRRAR